MAKMLVIYPTPADVQAFERHYFETHIPLAKTLPGMRKYEIDAGPILMPVNARPIHRIAILQFDDMAAIRAAFASPEGQAAAVDRRIYAPDASGVEMFLFDDRTV